MKENKKEGKGKKTKRKNDNEGEMKADVRMEGARMGVKKEIELHVGRNSHIKDKARYKNIVGKGNERREENKKRKRE